MMQQTEAVKEQFILRIEDLLNKMYKELDRLGESDIDHVDAHTLDEMRSDMHEFTIKLILLKEGLGDEG